jgi:hypothetical protein
MALGHAIFTAIGSATAEADVLRRVIVDLSGTATATATRTHIQSRNVFAEAVSTVQAQGRRLSLAQADDRYFIRRDVLRLILRQDVAPYMTERAVLPFYQDIDLIPIYRERPMLPYYTLIDEED